jgi:hypothetical protein
LALLVLPLAAACGSAARSEKNLSRGCAFFRFESAGHGRSNPSYTPAAHACEKRGDLAARISKIFEEDRPMKPGDL